MDAQEPAFAGIARQAELIASGEVNSRDLVELYLERIGRLDAHLNCFRVVFTERARLEADQADARRAAGEQRPLLGVPVAIKDHLDVAGDVTALGTNAYGEPATADAELVRRLREAGAVVIGKTHLPELAIWPFTESATYGATRNPWDPQRTTGGSSGGSAAAVAAGLVGAAVGSDGAGSIRIPSSWCGLFGLKPQRDRVPLAPLEGHWHGLSVNGVLTRSVADTALFLDVVTSADGGQTESFSRAVASPSGPLKIAVSRRIPPGPITRLDADGAAALERTAQLLRSLGHEVTERDPDYGPNAIGEVLVRYLRGICDDAAEMPHPERLERRTRGMARLGALIPAALLERSLAAEANFARRLNGVLEDNDVLLTPATCCGPPPIGRLQGRGALWTLNAVGRWVPYNGIWNVTGQPAASVPAGFDTNGMPRGVQIVARPNDEATLLSLAAQIEAERPWAQARPPEPA
jgi:amidase